MPRQIWNHLASVVIAFVVLEGSLFAMSLDELRDQYRQLYITHASHLNGKHYPVAELYERNRAVFRERHQSFIEDYRSHMRRVPEPLPEAERTFEMQVKAFHLSLMASHALVGIAPTFELRFLFTPAELILAFPWDDATLQRLADWSHRRPHGGATLALPHDLTQTLSQARLIKKYLDYWSFVLSPETLRKELIAFGEKLRAANTDDPFVFRKIVDGIINTQDGKAFWIMEYALKGDKRYYKPRFEACYDALAVK